MTEVLRHKAGFTPQAASNHSLLLLIPHNWRRKTDAEVEKVGMLLMEECAQYFCGAGELVFATKDASATRVSLFDYKLSHENDGMRLTLQSRIEVDFRKFVGCVATGALSAAPHVQLDFSDSTQTLSVDDTRRLNKALEDQFGSRASVAPEPPMGRMCWYSSAEPDLTF